jgi:hypothetical protein
VVHVPKVFVSYAHESAGHKEQVRAFATFLRDSGLDAVLDLWSAGARQDWYSWAIREMTDADFVLVVASAQYRVSGDGVGPSGVNRGVQSEATLLREFVYRDRETWLPKVLPVLLPGHVIDEIPLFLQPYTASRYEVTSFTTEGADELLRVLLRRPGYPAPEVRPDQPELPPYTAKPADVAEPREDEPRERGRVVNQIIGTVTGKVVQADTIEGDINF